MVLGYWIGSASSSRLKDDTISNIATAPVLVTSTQPLPIKDEIPIPNHPKTPK